MLQLFKFGLVLVQADNNGILKGECCQWLQSWIGWTVSIDTAAGHQTDRLTAGRQSNEHLVPRVASAGTPNAEQHSSRLDCANFICSRVLKCL
jgi:hypothetical protein